MLYGKAMLRRFECRFFAAQQFDGHEGETATLLFGVSVKFKLAWRQFRTTFSQALKTYQFAARIISHHF